MKRLEAEIKVQNRTLKQIKRQGRVALYALYGPQGTLYGWELVIVKERPAEEIFGKLYPERELYPSSSKESNDWGNIAWSYGSAQRLKAFAAFNHLCRKQVQGGPEVFDLVAGSSHLSEQRLRVANPA